MSTVVRSGRGADIHSSLGLLRVLESPANPHDHFPLLDSLSFVCSLLSGSLADRKVFLAAATYPWRAARSTRAARTTLGQDWLGLVDGRVDSDQFQHCDPH